ncbi:MAG TPA: VCBS repeat-containing protein [Bryobacteraceae bacterium]|nr:VCBS repeat-containing protein [Bryobacteraceae bacterium]
MRFLLLSVCASLLFAADRNRQSNSLEVETLAGIPVRLEIPVARGFSADSLRLYEDAGRKPIPVKVEYRRPSAILYFQSTGAKKYIATWDVTGQGETERVAAPAMVGSGDRVTFGRAGVRGNLAVGLYSHAAAIDWDNDGKLDLIVASPDRPYNGTYLFRNIGTQAEPLFDRAVWLAPALKNLMLADVDGDGNIDATSAGGRWFSDIRRAGFTNPRPFNLKRTYHVGRDDLWLPVDWDGDGKIDLLNGVSDWREYGWDDAFNSKGEWLRGPLHGYVYLWRNSGTNAEPAYDAPVQLPIDSYGSPSPQLFPWKANAPADLLIGSFLDYVTLHQRTDLTQSKVLPFRFDLEMIEPRVVKWHKDARPSILVGEEGGTLSLVENLAPFGQEPKWAEPRKLEQVDPYVKSGSLSRPVAIDWNGDGKLDLVAGNSAGYLEWWENTGTWEVPVFTARGYFRVHGKPIRRVAGANKSIQGPAEAKWGYSNPTVVDWDLDGKLDILVNDIWGEVVWYRGTGDRQELEPARNLEVEWPGATPKPEWVWWEPQGKQLLTQWRTTPEVVDWDKDGLPDLVMLNHQGYLCLFRRAKKDGKLVLGPPERIFVLESGRFLNLANGRAGSSGRRKVDLVDWDGDGDLDLLTDSDQGPIWYENVGTTEKPVMANRGLAARAPIAGHNPTPNAADWNGDGKLDLLIGGEDGFFYFYDRRFIDSRGPALK